MFKLKLANLWRQISNPQPETASTTSASKSSTALAQGHSGSNVVLIERDDQLNKLKSLWQEAVAGKGHVVLLAGEAGYGKTSLSNLLIALLAGDTTPPKVARAACSPQADHDQPFYVFTDAFSQLVTTSPQKITGEVFDAFLEFAPSWAAVIPVAGPVIGASLKTAQVVRNRSKPPDSPTPDKLLAEYTDALKKVADKHPVLMFIDDLHWSDPSSIKLLSHLARSVADMRVLIVGAYRPSDIAVEGHPLRDLIGEMLRYDKDVQMVLNPLSEGGVRTLVNKLYPVNKFPDTLAEYLVNTTGGAPLFVVESLRLMQDRGDIVHDAKDGKWTIAHDLNEGDLPRDVEAIINKRLERLPDDLREALALAAVQGASFDTAVLAYALNKEELEVLKLLEPAEKTHNVIEYAGDVDLGLDVTSRYRFTSNLFRRELLETLRGKKRMMAFRHTAEGLDGLWDDDSEDVAAKLANLYGQGKVYDAAARFMIIAGHYASQAGSIPQAVELYEQAERALDKVHPANQEDEALIVKQRQQIDEALSYLSEVDASYDKSEARTRSVLAQGLEALGWSKYADLRMRLAALMVRAGRFTEALEELQSLDASLETTPAEQSHSYEAFQLRAEIAKVLALLGRADESAQMAEGALKELDALPETDWRKAARARLTTSLAMAYHERGEYRQAIKVAEGTLDVLRELSMASTSATLLSTLAQLYVEVGEYDHARESIKLMEKVATETSNESLLASAHLSAGLIHAVQGEPEAALAELDQADQFADQVKMFEERPKILMLRTFALLDSKRLDEAKATLDRVIPMVKDSPLRVWQAYAQLAQARYELEAGDAQAAAELAKAAAQVFRDEGTRFDEAIALRGVARAHRQLGQADDASAEYERASALFKLIGNDALAEMISREANEVAHVTN